MKSEVFKKYTSGFTLTEQDLRRVWNCCEQHLNKIKPTERHIKIEATLHDASVITTQTIDDVLALENGGAKRVSKVNLFISDAEKNPTFSIEVNFSNGHENVSSWTSMALLVRGTDRDWVFLAADEIEDRLKRLRCLAFEYLANHRLVFPVLMGVGLLVAFNFIQFDSPALKLKLQEIETSMTNALPPDPVRVIIDVERAKMVHRPFFMLPFVLSAFVMPLLLWYMVGEIVPKFFKSYHFCWGEYLALYERRKARARIFWIAGVLGVIASIIAGIILKYFHAT